MRRVRRERRRPSHDRWLVSYADFITLLFAFFVVMYSAAQLDKRRAGKLATAIQTAFSQHGSLPPKPAEVGGLSANGEPSNLPVGNAEGEEFGLLKGQIETALTTEIAAGDVVVRQTGEGLVVSLREIGFFDTGSDEIKPSSAGAFARLAEILRATNREIRIEGHTDNVPIQQSDGGGCPRRRQVPVGGEACVVVQSYGLRPELLGASGYAEFRSVASNATAEGRAANRRVDIVIPKKP